MLAPAHRWNRLTTRTTPGVPSYRVLNLRYTVDGKWGSTPWSVSLWSNNVTNKRYVLGGLAVAGRHYNYGETPGLPRTIGATFRVDR